MTIAPLAGSGEAWVDAERAAPMLRQPRRFLREPSHHRLLPPPRASTTPPLASTVCHHRPLLPAQGERDEHLPPPASRYRPGQARRRLPLPFAATVCRYPPRASATSTCRHRQPLSPGASATPPAASRPR